MAIDRKIPVVPPADTSMAFFAQQVQQELTPIWENVILELTVGNTGNALVATASPALLSYTDAKYFAVTFPATNTGPMSLSVDGLSAFPLRDAAGHPWRQVLCKPGNRRLFTTVPHPVTSAWSVAAYLLCP